MNANPGRAIAAGFLATVAMTMLMYTGPMMGMPKMDIAAMLGSFLGVGWGMGMLIHFINGSIIFALIYAYVVYRAVPGSPTVRGVIWGTILWVIAQVMVMPMMGNGFFSANTPQPAMMVFGSLLGHLVYGGILGVGAGVQTEGTTVRHPSAPRARA